MNPRSIICANRTYEKETAPMHHLFTNLLVLRRGVWGAYEYMHYTLRQLTRKRERFEAYRDLLAPKIRSAKTENNNLEVVIEEAIARTIEAFFNERTEEAREGLAYLRELQRKQTELALNSRAWQSKINACHSGWRQALRIFQDAEVDYEAWLAALIECECAILTLFNIPPEDWEDSIITVTRRSSGHAKLDIFFGGLGNRPFGLGHGHLVANPNDLTQQHWRRDPFEDAGVLALSNTG